MTRSTPVRAYAPSIRRSFRRAAEAGLGSEEVGGVVLTCLRLDIQREDAQSGRPCGRVHLNPPAPAFLPPLAVEQRQAFADVLIGPGELAPYRWIVPGMEACVSRASCCVLLCWRSRASRSHGRRMSGSSPTYRRPDRASFRSLHLLGCSQSTVDVRRMGNLTVRMPRYAVSERRWPWRCRQR
jgi:hypothetical protein